ncbi:FecR domain-containing protein [Chitinophaga horti]|uniref:FecR domain-containing protein n=1 Tax=Chitinophaga horti TaxID=2920382 RepID=A0ABY6J3D2_9BACT|nr:FecR domain-containing protein [Chitinophaga horti]UYQ94173.1 FecR domain-containing protein [Chitinophaga horti]
MKGTNDDSTARGVSEAIDQLRDNPVPWNEASMGSEKATEEKILSRLLLSINETGSRPKRMGRRVFLWSAAAAVVVLVATVWYQQTRTVYYPQVLVATKAAQREKVVLPDGSEVLLNAGSRLQYPEQFGRDKREVTLLEGEAYFSVKADAKRPFIVQADSTRTTVLGTTFNVRAYHFIGEVTVTVSSGKVAVSATQELIVTPDQQVTYSKTKRDLQMKAVDADEVLGWIDGKLVFANETFGQVAGLLENKYNVKIVFDDPSLTRYHFTATFEATETLNDVLDALTLTKGLEYTATNNTIHIFQSKI